MKYSKKEVSESMEYLHKFLKPGSTVYTVLRHVSRSGMSRRIDLYAMVCDEKGGSHMAYLSHAAAVVMGDSRPNDGIRVGGCGMDMGFHLVYNLGHTLYPNGFKLAKGQYGRNGDTSGHDTDGGYALKHSWL